MRKNIVSFALLGFMLSPANAQDRFAEVEINAINVAGSVYMLTGVGGNIGISSGTDGVLMIDDQYAPLAERITNAIASIADASPRFIVNTHYHGDHVGSNAFFSENKASTIFAHENVRIRLANGEDIDPKSLPVVTYQDGIKFHINDDTVHVFHISNAHTDGDSVIWFENANVLHTGDLFFNNMFPYIDLGAGGTVQGYMNGIRMLLDKIDNETKIIPGHGALATKSDYAATLAMIEATYDYVQQKKAQGMSEEDVLAEGLDDKWQNWSWRFINTERWIKTLYQ